MWPSSSRPGIVNQRKAVFHCPLLVAAMFAFVGCGNQASPKAATPPPPPEVLVTEVMQQDVPIYFEWIGTTEGNVNAQIRPRVQGSLRLRDYREGSLVKAGQLMFAIDPSEYQAALNQAMGDLRRAEANLGKTKDRNRRLKNMLEDFAKPALDLSPKRVTEDLQRLLRVNNQLR